MPSAWKIRGKTGGSGPTWDAMSTDDTDDYDALTGHNWDWASDWTIFAQKIAVGEYWSSVSYLCADDPTTYKPNPWTITSGTKAQEATET